MLPDAMRLASLGSVGKHSKRVIVHIAIAFVIVVIGRRGRGGRLACACWWTVGDDDWRADVRRWRAWGFVARVRAKLWHRVVVFANSFDDCSGV